jgi:hypothetical protein
LSCEQNKKSQRAQAEPSTSTDHFLKNDRFLIKKLARDRLQHLTHSFYYIAKSSRKSKDVNDS